MLKEFIEKIQSLAEKGIQPTVTTHPRLRGKVIVSHQDGAGPIESPPDIIDILGDMSSFKQMRDDLQEDQSCEDIKIFYDQDVVEIRGRMKNGANYTGRMPLRPSPWVQSLVAANGKKITHTALLRLLRFSLYDKIDDGIFNVFRRIEWSRKNDGVSEKSRGAESLGRSVESKVNNVDALPDSFLASGDLYQLAGFVSLVTLRVFVDPVPAEELFQIDLAPDAVNDATDAILAKIRDELQDYDSYRGSRTIKYPS